MKWILLSLLNIFFLSDHNVIRRKERIIHVMSCVVVCLSKFLGNSLKLVVIVPPATHESLKQIYKCKCVRAHSFLGWFYVLDLSLLCNKFFHTLGYFCFMNLSLLPSTSMMPSLFLLLVIQPDKEQTLDLWNWIPSLWILKLGTVLSSEQLVKCKWWCKQCAGCYMASEPVFGSQNDGNAWSFHPFLWGTESGNLFQSGRSVKLLTVPLLVG